jgi:large subunit ribosomal protein L10
MAKKEKEIIVQQLAEKIKNNNGVVLTEYQGLTVAEITELRAKLRTQNCEYRVIKNTLSRRALKEIGLEEFEKYFEGPTAIAFEKGDPVGPAKTLFDFSKEHAKLKLKAGLLGKKILNTDDLKSLASLPSREVLIGKMLGTMQAPMYNLVNVLQATPRNLVYVLEAIRKQRSNG